MSKTKGALFVCLGNICRSPIAEAVFLHLLKERNIAHHWHVDSAGTTDCHAGKPADERALKVLASHDMQYSKRARLILTEDFKKFDYIFGMDDDNMHDLDELAPKNSSANLRLLGDFDPEGDRIIRDPYFDSHSKGFYKCYDQCVRCCTTFLDRLK